RDAWPALRRLGGRGVAPGVGEDLGGEPVARIMESEQDRPSPGVEEGRDDPRWHRIDDQRAAVRRREAECASISLSRRGSFISAGVRTRSAATTIVAKSLPGLPVFSPSSRLAEVSLLPPGPVPLIVKRKRWCRLSRCTGFKVTV